MYFTTFSYISQTCDYDGIFKFPDGMNMSSCRSKSVCSSSPVPSDESNLELVPLSQGTVLREHEIQEYACKSDKTLKGIKHELVNDDFKVEVPCITGRFQI